MRERERERGGKMLQRRIGVALSRIARHYATAAAAAAAAAGPNSLCKRLLGLVHPKRSAVVAIRKWKEEGRGVRKYELNRIVRELRRLNRFKHALEICEWMKTQEVIKLLPGDYAIHLDLIAKLRGLNGAEKYFEDLPEKMIGAPTLSALLHIFVQHHAYANAEALMEKMLKCGYVNSPLPYNHMISMYLENGQLDKIPALIGELKKNATLDTVTYNLWLTMCQSQSDVETAEKALLEMKASKVEPDWMTYSILSSLYSKKGLNDKALSFLKDMEKRVTRKHRAAYSSLMSLHTNLGNKNDVRAIWRKMKSIFRKLNDAEYICMISSLIKLGELKEAEELYDEWELVSTTGDSRIPNLLVAAYINQGQIERAERFFNRFARKGIEPSYTTWELLTWGNLKQKRVDRALDCFEKAVCSVKIWQPDMRIIHEIHRHLEDQENFEGAEKFLSVLGKAGYVTTEIYNMLFRTFAKAGKLPPIITQRMLKDKVVLDRDSGIRLTTKMCVGDVSSCLT